MKQRSFTLIHALVVVAVALLWVPGAWAKPKFKVLHNFTGGNDGSDPVSGLIFDQAGNLYGTTWGAGSHSCGTVFELTPTPTAEWSESQLLNLDCDNDGQGPVGGLVFDSAGNLYGTASNGGLHNGGTVFELTPSSGGWIETTLYNFCSEGSGQCTDGGGPEASMVFDEAGSLYGTCRGGGIYYGGVAFQLMPGSGSWTENVLHTFDGEHENSDGSNPYDSLIRDAIGNLYGTTFGGGKFGGGTAFELERDSGGKWRERRLHNFGSFQNDGAGLSSGLVFDGAGNLYGTTTSGGRNSCISNCGTVFMLTLDSSGRWKETVLYNFRPGDTGNYPDSVVVFDKKGNLYGTTGGGGIGHCAEGCGVVYKLERGQSGEWKYTVLHRFAGPDGANPGGGLILDNKGNLYGTTELGGTGTRGVVFEITP